VRLRSANLAVFLAFSFLTGTEKLALGEEGAAHATEFFFELSSQLEEYRLLYGEYPLQVPHGFLGEGANLVDPLGQSFRYYRIPSMVGGGYLLVSYGEDGKAGGTGRGKDVVLVQMGPKP